MEPALNGLPAAETAPTIPPDAEGCTGNEITVGGRPSAFRGRFDRYEDAVKAREEAEQKLYDSFLERYRKGQTEPED